MRRELMMALLGASILIPADADAQRNRNGNRGREERAGQPAPIRASGRIAYPVRPASRHRAKRASRVIYSNRGRSRSPAMGRFWIRADWGRIRMQPLRHRGPNVVLDKSDLRHLLGRETVNRVRNAGRRVGLRGAMRGRWVGGRGRGQVLVVTMGGADVAEFADFDRDGFIDDVFLIGEGRGRRVTHGW